MNPTDTQLPPPEVPVDTGSEALSEALRSSFAVLKLVMWVLLIVFLGSGFFTVGSQEKAIVLRFGRPVGEGEKALLSSGLHWSFPYPIDEIVRIPITEIQTVTSTIGWYYLTPEQELSRNEPPIRDSLNPAYDGYLITADANILHGRVRLYYRINDPVAYVFGFVNASNAVQNALDNALLSTAARFQVDDALYRDIAGFKDEVRRRVAQLIERQNLGVDVDHCDILGLMPPRQLKSAFQRVTTARENRTKQLNEAHTKANQLLYQAGAQAAALTNEAAADRTRLVQSITADARRFSDLLPKYKENPELFKQVQLLGAMNSILTNVQDKIFLSKRPDGQSRELRLLLNREPPKPLTQP